MGGIANIALAPITGGASLIPGVSDSAGSFLGGAGDALTGKNGYRAGVAQIDSPVTVDQAKDAYDQAQNALAAQNSFVTALQGQNGIANQTSAYNQLQGVANGTGPNPAQAQLAQSTGANVANQASLMAGQRGASGNAGLLARQAALQGGNIQQQAAGQGATLQAQQSLSALGQLSGIAGNQVSQQQNALATQNQAAQNEQQNLLNSINNVNSSRVSASNGENTVNAGITGANAQGKASFANGLLGGGASALGLARGGQVPHLYGGGDYGLGVNTSMSAPPAPFGGLGVPIPVAAGAAPTSNAILDFLHNTPDHSADKTSAADSFMAAQGSNAEAAGGQAIGKAAGSGLKSLLGSMGPAAAAMSGGGRVNAMLSPGEAYIPPNNVKKIADKEADPKEAGKIVPGKAKVKGDSLKNDTIPASLEEGGVVIPRSIMESKDAEEKAAKFVRAILAKNGQGMKRK